MSKTPRMVVTVDCADCGGPFEAQLVFGRQVGFYCGRCRDVRSRAELLESQERRRLRVEHGREEWLNHPRSAPPRYRGNGWDNFSFDVGGEGNRAKVEGLRAYAEAFPVDVSPKGYPSLVLASAANGVGKTMLACLVLETIYRRLDPTDRETPPVQFWAIHDLKQRMTSSVRYTSTETQEQVMRELASLWLLIIDDVGKERLGGHEADAAYDMYFSIINARYNADLPILLTTNLGFTPWNDGSPSLVDLMGRASVSRLIEMTGGKIYVIDGEDRR